MKFTLIFLGVLACAGIGNAFLLSYVQQVAKSIELVTSVNTALFQFLSIASNGVYFTLPNNKTLLNTTLVTLPGGQRLDAGALTLPLDFLCNQRGILKAVTCHACSYDCTYVHNKYGGKCGRVAPEDAVPNTPQAIGDVCICNDLPPTDGSDISNVNSTCGNIVDDLTDPTIVLAVKTAFRDRMIALQCPPLDPTNSNNLLANNAGCKSDCVTNHQYKDGQCGFNNATDTFTGELNVGFNCRCFYDDNQSLFPVAPETST